LSEANAAAAPYALIMMLFSLPLTCCCTFKRNGLPGDGFSRIAIGPQKLWDGGRARGIDLSVPAGSRTAGRRLLRECRRGPRRHAAEWSDELRSCA
jgi:hypothetical protein